MNTNSKLIGSFQGQSKSALADALGNVIKDTYITNVTWDSSTHILAFWGGSVLKYSCVIELAPQPLIDDPTKPLYLLSKQNGSTVTLGAVGTVGNTYQTSTDGTNWSDYTLGTSIPLDDGEGVYFRCTAFNTQFSYSAYVHFVMTGLIEAYHNINSMVSSSFDSLYDLTSLTYGGWCLNSLFEECASLTKAPLLPATTLSEGCYAAMFYFTTTGQSQLVQPPTLPATTLTSQCYSNMFEKCTSLTQAPELPATTLATFCYLRMFNGCTSLTQAPELPATTLTTSCYSSMFASCSSLNEVRIAATDISASSCLSGWLLGVSSTGNFYCEPGIIYPLGISGIPTNWVRHDIPAIEDDVNKPLYFLSKQNGSTLRLANNSLGGTYQTSTDNVTWSDYTFGTDIVLNKGEGVYFRIKSERTASGSDSKYINFRILSGRIEAYHNVLSLIHPTDFPNITSNTGSNLFYKLFEAASSDVGLYRAPLLPLLAIGTYSYSRMFYGCTHLTTSPALPATTLNTHCYRSTFSGCTSLTEAPALPATALYTLCYSYMFKDCTRLVKAPALPATSLVGSSTTNGCYTYMFQNCTSLSEIRIYATTNVSSNPLIYWLSGASSSGNFYCVPGVTFPSGTSGIPSGWTRRNINDYPSN